MLLRLSEEEQNFAPHPKNDISMFDVSDECYAVENADPELKRRATAVIESNDNDGVARWLLEHWQK